MRIRLAARNDYAIEARALSGQSHVCAKTPPRPEGGTNPDDSDDERRKAESPRSPRSSAPSPWVLRHSCGQLPWRPTRGSLSNRLRIQASGSSPDNSGSCPDLAGAGTVSCEPALSVSEVGPAAKAHPAV